MAADFRRPVIPKGVQETGCKKQGKGDKCHGNVDSATLSRVRKDHAAYISSNIFPSKFSLQCNARCGISRGRVVYFRARKYTLFFFFFDRFNDRRDLIRRGTRIAPPGNQDRGCIFPSIYVLINRLLGGGGGEIGVLIGFG